MTKALIIAPGYPYPMDGGNKVALHGFHVGLKAAGIDEIDFVGFYNGVEPNDEFASIELIKKPPRLTVPGIGRHLFGKSILFERYLSNELASTIKRKVKAKKYDVVLFQHGYMAQYLSNLKDDLSGVLKIASAEVLESRAYREKAKLSGNKLIRYLLTREANLLDKQETASFEDFDKVTFFSPEDFAHYRACGGKSNGEIINLGLDLERYEIVGPTPDGPLSVAFFGSFSWFANLDALIFLLDDVWPAVVSEIPDAVLKVAGRDIPSWVSDRKLPGVQVLGKVESIPSLLKGVHAVLSPIRIGGGVRLKILESIAWGRPVISTRVGVEGLETELAEQVIIADSPKDFTDKLKIIHDQSVDKNNYWKSSEIVRERYDAGRLASLFTIGLHNAK